MEKNVENILKELKEKYYSEETAFDTVDMEKCLREFKTELYIKRDQVKQLRNDLEIATIEAKGLKSALYASNKALDEKNFNLSLLTNKFRNTEDELMEKTDGLNALQTQNNLTMVELEKIKELLQKSEAEKMVLSRKLEVFETKQRQNFIYHNQILKRETNLKCTIEEIQEMIKKLKTEQCEVTELSKKTKIATDSNEKLQQLSLNYQTLKKEKEHLEELYTKINAKYEMLEELIEMNKDLNDPNLINKIIFNQWKSNRKHYELLVDENNELLKQLTDCYNNEKLVNSHLIQKNEQITEENQNLKTELEQMTENHHEELETLKQKLMEFEEKFKALENAQEKIEIKDEPIEIID